MIHKKCEIANLTLGFSFKQSNDDKRNKSHTSVSRCINSTCWFILKRHLFESFLCLSLFKVHEGLITSYVLKCYCRFKTRGTSHLNSAAHEGKSLKCCLSLKSVLLEIAVSDTIEYKTVPKWYLWLRFMNVKQRLNEFLNMQLNSIVIQLNAAMAQLPITQVTAVSSCGTCSYGQENQVPTRCGEV